MYWFKNITMQHLHVYKRMSECNTLTNHQTKLQKVMEDIRRLCTYKFKLNIEEVTQLKKREAPGSGVESSLEKEMMSMY